MSSVANPAAGAAALSKEDGQYRAGLITIGGGYEVGNVNNLANQIDSTQAKLNQTVDVSTLSDGAAVAAYINANLIAPVNSLTNTLQKDGNASVYFGGHIPVMPLVISKKKLGGSFVLDANVSAIANASFIADPFSPITDAEGTVILGGGSYTLPITNDSTLLVKAAVTSELGLGYSRSILKREVGDYMAGEMTADKLKAGELTAGVRLKYYQVKLANKAQRQQTATGGAQSSLNASQTYTSNSGVGLDVGTLWTSRRYRVGAWVSNLNKPSFKYSAIDLNGLGYTNAGIISQLSASTTYDMKPQLQMEGAVFSESQNWVINGGLDANAVKDAVGREFQWMTLSAAYATNSWWIPGARVGYRSNRAGSKLSYLTGGLTLFKALSLDAAVSTAKVTDNKGKSAPRSAMINLNLQMTF